MGNTSPTRIVDEIEQVPAFKDYIANIPGKKGDKGEIGPVGPRGDPFAYQDFTQEQLDSLIGPRGFRGDAGPPGEPGPAIGLNLSGSSIYSIPYQLSSSTTSYITPSTTNDKNKLLQFNSSGNGYVWTDPGSLSVNNSNYANIANIANNTNILGLKAQTNMTTVDNSFNKGTTSPNPWIMYSDNVSGGRLCFKHITDTAMTTTNPAQPAKGYCLSFNGTTNATPYSFSRVI